MFHQFFDKQSSYFRKAFPRLYEVVVIAADAILVNKFRSVLSALGIIFGVSAFIAMLAIGKGAKYEIMEQLKMVGVNNIIISPRMEEDDEQNEEEQDVKSHEEKRNLSKGLTLLDAESINSIPSVKIVSPEIISEVNVLRKGRRQSAKLVGVNLNFFRLYDNFKIIKGKLFNEKQMESVAPVCVIGKQIQVKLFSREDPIWKWIKCNNIWFKVIGVIGSGDVTGTVLNDLGIRDANRDIYVPIKSVLLRFENKGLITKATIRKGRYNVDGKDKIHQLDKIVVQVENTELLKTTANIISRMLLRRHYEMVDFEVTIPELLLKQQQRTKEIFNIVLGTIASISLIVGGIGIMNIMLASVMERIREIGLRLAVGATKRDIVFQFLAESVLISLAGGGIGVVFGIAVTKIITQISGIMTIISFSSIIISFGVAALVGLVFGIMPAKRAAEKNPVDSLRYE